MKDAPWTINADGTLWVPVAYREEDDPDKFWSPDLCDYAMPKQKGFISDLVYFMRGMEVPTLFTVWSALWLLSTIVKREAWLKWYPRNMYCNLYVILAGPAGCKKSTTIDDIGVPLVEEMRKYIDNDNIKNMKNVHIVKDKVTPEAMIDAMLPGNKPGKSSFAFTDEEGSPVLDAHGKAIRYKATSETGIVLSEMSSSVGKKSYMEGFIEILLDLYNPKDAWEWRKRGEGLKKLQRTYVTFLAATTPAGFKDSIPRAAAGDGFLSRCVLVYQALINRRFPMPRPVLNGPSFGELAKRAAWICENTIGEYQLSEDAFRLYEKWYDGHKDYLAANTEEGGIRGRMDLNLLKVSLLLRAQRYEVEPERVITKSDMEDAISLINLTYGMSQELLTEMGDGLRKKAALLTNIVQREGRLNRTAALRKSHFPVDEFNTVVDYLVQIGEIRIELDGVRKRTPSKNGREEYVSLSKQIREAEEHEEEERRRIKNAAAARRNGEREKERQEAGEAVNI